MVPMLYARMPTPPCSPLWMLSNEKSLWLWESSERTLCLSGARPQSPMRAPLARSSREKELLGSKIQWSWPTGHPNLNIWTSCPAWSEIWNDNLEKKTLAKCLFILLFEMIKLLKISWKFPNGENWNKKMNKFLKSLPIKWQIKHVIFIIKTKV